MHNGNLWAPWRMSYIHELGDKLDASSSSADGESCFLCQAAAADLDDEHKAQRLVLIKDERGVLLLNRYPYANGHLLVAPCAHVADLSDLAATQRGGLMELAELGHRLLKGAMNPQGVNIGMNLGRCAGAGLPGHVHMHVVPRWHGDINFMQVVGQVRVIPQALEESYKALAEQLAKITS